MAKAVALAEAAVQLTAFVEAEAALRLKFDGENTAAGLAEGNLRRWATSDRCRALATAVGVFEASRLGSTEVALHLLFCMSGCMWSAYLADLKGHGERLVGTDS